MSKIEKIIRQKLDDTIEQQLLGAAADYTAYASLVARYRVLKELVDEIADMKKEPPSIGDPED
jgi:hypothetical protein